MVVTEYTDIICRINITIKATLTHGVAQAREDLFMKTSWLLATLGLSVSTAGFAMTETEAEIAKRIKPVGSVYLAGSEPEVVTPTGPRTGEQVYTQVCSSCHSTGLLGAPIAGDADAWAPRKAKGMDVLLNSALNGLNNMTPQKAMGSEEEIAAAIQFMLGEG